MTKIATSITIILAICLVLPSAAVITSSTSEGDDVVYGTVGNTLYFNHSDGHASANVINRACGVNVCSYSDSKLVFSTSCYVNFILNSPADSMIFNDNSAMELCIAKGATVWIYCIFLSDTADVTTRFSIINAQCPKFLISGEGQLNVTTMTEYKAISERTDGIRFSGKMEVRNTTLIVSKAVGHHDLGNGIYMLGSSLGFYNTVSSLQAADYGVYVDRITKSELVIDDSKVILTGELGSIYTKCNWDTAYNNVVFSVSNDPDGSELSVLSSSPSPNKLGDYCYVRTGSTTSGFGGSGYSNTTLFIFLFVFFFAVLLAMAFITVRRSRGIARQHRYPGAPRYDDPYRRDPIDCIPQEPDRIVYETAEETKTKYQSTEHRTIDRRDTDSNVSPAERSGTVTMSIRSIGAPGCLFQVYIDNTCYGYVTSNKVYLEVPKGNHVVTVRTCDGKRATIFSKEMDLRNQKDLTVYKRFRSYCVEVTDYDRRLL